MLRRATCKVCQQSWRCMLREGLQSCRDYVRELCCAVSRQDKPAGPNGGCSGDWRTFVKHASALVPSMFIAQDPQMPSLRPHDYMSALMTTEQNATAYLSSTCRAEKQCGMSGSPVMLRVSCKQTARRRRMRLMIAWIHRRERPLTGRTAGSSACGPARP